MDQPAPRYVHPIALGVGLAAFAWYAWLAPHGCITRDEAWLLDCADRVARGEWPLRDFKTIYGPGLYVIFGMVLKVFGPDLLAVRLTWAVLRALVAVATWRIGARLLPWPMALGAAATITLAPGPWHKTLFALITGAVLLSAIEHLATGERRQLRDAGWLAGLGAWFRQDAAAFVAIGVCSAWVAEGLLARRAGDADRAARAWASLKGFLVPCASAFLLLLAVQAPLVSPLTFFQALVFDAAQAGHPAGTRVADLIGGDTVRYGALTGLAIGTVVAMVAVAAGTLLQAGRSLAQGPSARSLGLWMLAATALASVQQLVETNALTRLLQCGLPFHLLWFLSTSVEGSGLRQRATRALGFAWPALLVALLSITGPNAVFSPEYGGSVGLLLDRTRPFEVRGRTYYCSLDGVRQMRELRELTTEIPPGASLFVAPHPPSLNFLSGHRNPTRYIRVDESAPASLRAALEEIRGGAGNWMLLQTDQVTELAPDVRTLLADQFVREAEQGKFTLWRRKAASRREGEAR
jgi:hypothetical protein